MAPLAETVAAQTDDLLHHAEDRIADALGLLLEAGEIDVLDPALPHDLARGLLGDDAEARGAGECGLDLEVVGRPFSSEKTARISGVLKMSRKIAESSAVAVMLFPRLRRLAPARQAVEMGEHLLDVHDVGVFVMQIEQIDLVAER